MLCTTASFEEKSITLIYNDYSCYSMIIYFECRVIKELHSHSKSKLSNLKILRLLILKIFYFNALDFESTSVSIFNHVFGLNFSIIC